MRLYRLVIKSVNMSPVGRRMWKTRSSSTSLTTSLFVIPGLPGQTVRNTLILQAMNMPIK